MGSIATPIVQTRNNMEKSKKYFSHYFKEIQATKDKFKDFVARNESETQKLIELKDFSDSKDGDDEKNAISKEVLESYCAAKDEPLDDKAKLIKDIKELNMTIEDITKKIVNVKTETTKLTEENKVIDDYIVSLMEQSKTFEPTDLIYLINL